jgi:hypothetical protein
LIRYYLTALIDICMRLSRIVSHSKACRENLVRLHGIGSQPTSPPPLIFLRDLFAIHDTASPAEISPSYSCGIYCAFINVCYAHSVRCAHSVCEAHSVYKRPRTPSLEYNFAFALAEPFLAPKIFEDPGYFEAYSLSTSFVRD